MWFYNVYFSTKSMKRPLTSQLKVQVFKKILTNSLFFCLLSFAFSLSSFQAILYCPVIWATDAKSFYPFIPQSWRICSKCGKAVGSQARAAWGELKEGGSFCPWDHKSISLATRQEEDSVERDAMPAASCITFSSWRRRVYKWLFPSIDHKGFT